MPQKHYTPPLSRFIVRALFHEAKARGIPMTRLANDLVEAGLKETPGWKEAQAQEAMRMGKRVSTRESAATLTAELVAIPRSMALNAQIPFIFSSASQVP